MSRSLPWHEDVAFWDAVDPFITSGPVRLEGAPSEVRDLLTLLEVDSPQDVLDLPCGAGRHTVELAALGHRVTAVDRTPSNIERTRQRCAERGVEPELVVCDMREFERDAAYDLALNLYTSIGYFQDAEDERRTLLNFFNSLRPGGRLVIETMAREVLARRFRERDWQRVPEGFLLEERRVNDDWTVIESNWTLIRGTEASEHIVRLRLYSAQELKGLLHDVGFSDVFIHGSLAGAPYDHFAQRLAIVARK